jgi:hypothetical protein
VGKGRCRGIIYWIAQCDSLKAINSTSEKYFQFKNEFIDASNGSARFSNVLHSYFHVNSYIAFIASLHEVVVTYFSSLFELTIFTIYDEGRK